jgi:hypothetical protein
MANTFNFDLDSPPESPKANLFGDTMEDVGGAGKLLVGAEGGLKPAAVSFAAEVSSVISSSSRTRAELLVGVVVLKKAEFGLAFCGGPLGRKKICIKANCTVSSHKPRKGDSPFEGIDDDDSLVCIVVPSSTLKSPPTAVYYSPTLPLSAIPDGLDILSDQKPVDGWLSLMRGIEELSSSATTEDFEDLASRSKKEVLLSLTPHKAAKLSKDSPLMVAVSKEEDEFVDLGINAGVDFLSAEEMGDSDQEMLFYLRSTWPRVKSLFENLHGMVLKNRNLSRRNATQIEESLEMLDLKVVRLGTQVGDRPMEGNTSSLFNQVTELEAEVERVSNEIKLDEAVFQFRIKEAVSDSTTGLRRDVQAQFKPIVELFNVFSSSPTTAGDHFQTFGRDVQKAVVEIKQRTRTLDAGMQQCIGAIAVVKKDLSDALNALGAAQRPTGTIPPPNPNDPFAFWPAGNTDAPPAPLAPSAQGANFDFSQLEARLRDLEEQLESTRVLMAGVSFSSLTNTGALLTRYAPTSAGRALFCFCPVSLLVVATPEMTSINEIVTYEGKASKLGASSLEATLCASYRQELPQFFGYLSKSVARDDRVLPAMATYDLWDSQSARAGGRYRMTSAVNSTVEGLIQSLSTNVTVDGLEVARTMLQDSRDFLNRLSSWITQSYQDLVNRGGSEKEAWAYVSHCVRAIFDLLFKARVAGRGPFLDDARRDAGMVWGALQCHAVCRSLMDANFSSHPTLSHILNLHLRDNAVMMSSMDAMSKRIDKMDVELKGTKKTAEKALSGKKGNN